MDAAPTELYTLSHTTLFRSSEQDTQEEQHGRHVDALEYGDNAGRRPRGFVERAVDELRDDPEDRKSTRLNSSHVKISYAVFCLKKKNQVIASIDGSSHC